MEPVCRRCGLTDKLEKHHKKHKVDGGSDKSPNRKWLCTDCHDFQHAKDTVMAAIKAEKERLAILEKRLEIIERENTPEKIRANGYQSYFNFYPQAISRTTKCGRV